METQPVPGAAFDALAKCQQIPATVRSTSPCPEVNDAGEAGTVQKCTILSEASTVQKCTVLQIKGSLTPAGEETGADGGKEKQAEAGKKTPESCQTFEVEEGKDEGNKRAVLSETLINVKTQFSWAKTDLFTEWRQFLSALCSPGYSSPWHLVTYLAHWCARTHMPLASPCRVQPAGGSCGFVVMLITLLTICNNFLGTCRNPLHSGVYFTKASSENGNGKRHGSFDFALLILYWEP